MPNMEVAEVEERVFAINDAKLHGGLCRKLSAVLCKAWGMFLVLEAARPGTKSGIQALCSLHVALEKAKNLLQHCSNCSKFYLAITGDAILLKFEKVKCALAESLKRMELIIPQASGCQVLEIVKELDGIDLALDPFEKQIGDEVIALLQQERKINSNSYDTYELETFYQAAQRLNITSSRAAVIERRALKKLIEKARAEGDKHKESIVAYLLHLIGKYSKLFRNEYSDDNDSQGSAPCSPTVPNLENGTIHSCTFDRQFSKLDSFNFRHDNTSGNFPLPPEELRCPISLQLMYDPVIISSGQTYERVCIEKWFGDGHNTCPKTQQKLSHLCLTPNYCVKGLIASWCEQNGVPFPQGPPESLDLNHWRLALSETEIAHSGSTESLGSCKIKESKLYSLPNSCSFVAHAEAIENLDDSFESLELVEFGRYEKLLSILYTSKNKIRQCKVVEKIRILVKDDEEARIFMGANGFIEALVKFLASAILEGDEKAQELGAMALFNLAVNNNRNKEVMLSIGIISILEEMIFNYNSYEAATALYLNLSCLDEAKPIIGSSQAVPFFIQLLLSENETNCKVDALQTLHNLSLHLPNIPNLLSANIIKGLQVFLPDSSGTFDSTLAEYVVAICLNLALDQSGKDEIISNPGFITGLAILLDSGGPFAQEQAITCLLILCDGDEKCCQLVLEEGVIPALVSISAKGTSRGKDKAQRLLNLFRQQRQREPLPIVQHVESSDCDRESRVTQRSTSKKFRRTLSSMWKSKNFSLYHC